MCEYKANRAAVTENALIPYDQNQNLVFISAVIYLPAFLLMKADLKVVWKSELGWG